MSTSTNAWLLAQKPAACTHATTNPTNLIQQAVSMLSPGRCTFLSNSPRMVLGDLLQDLGYRGWSAEVGVWKGDNSKQDAHVPMGFGRTALSRRSVPVLWRWVQRDWAVALRAHTAEV
eukprot:scaffold7660_cov154-Isochrysis_galbana.AAC.2